ncbi:recombinase family protein [Mycobacterium stomatepiae]|nr:recombinase family protein [Mycobacterium stomatepiae]
MRNEGFTYQRICDVLNEEGVPTPAGGPRWWRSHVWRLIHTRSAVELTSASRAAARTSVSQGEGD